MSDDDGVRVHEMAHLLRALVTLWPNTWNYAGSNMVCLLSMEVHPWVFIGRAIRTQYLILM